MYRFPFFVFFTFTFTKSLSYKEFVRAQLGCVRFRRHRTISSFLSGLSVNVSIDCIIFLATSLSFTSSKPGDTISSLRVCMFARNLMYFLDMMEMGDQFAVIFIVDYLSDNCVEINHRSSNTFTLSNP